MTKEAYSSIILDEKVLEMGKKIIRLGLFGLGTVGRGIVELLLRKKEEKGDYEFVLEKIAIKHLDKERPLSLSPHLLTTNHKEILENPKIDTIIEVMGGIYPAEEIILEALKRGKNVITANKALLARAGSRIFKEASENNCYLGVRGSNIASYRLIESITSSPLRISKLIGVFNGTCNYILTEMEKTKEDLFSMVKKAQEIGYAEKDPSDDIDGFDTAHKLVVLLGLTTGFFPSLDSFFIEGIRRISYQDILFAQELGYRVKLLAIARQEDNYLEARVHPALLPIGKGLARLEGIENGIELRDEIGLEIGMQAPGAGKYPTAAAILEDLICVAKGRKLFLPGCSENMDLGKIGEIEGNYYLRFSVLDRAGVLAKISGILGDYDISIKSVLQKGEARNSTDSVPIIMLTHKAREKAIQDALKRISDLSVVKEYPLLIRVEKGIF